MKKLEIRQLELIEGGYWRDYADGFCAGVGLASLFVPPNPVIAGCALYGLGRAFDII